MPCIDCGRPHRGTRCPTCQRLKDRGRGSTDQRGYGTEHQALREHWRPIVEAGGVICWRCDEPLEPDGPWALGHDDDDRGVYRGPEHVDCNSGAPSRRRRS